MSPIDNRVRIFDTTLRDGEQSPGATMSLEEKLRVARKLEALGVDVIEAGFPAASPGELDAVRQIAKTVTESEVCGLCRTRPRDIEAAWEAVQHATKPRLHVFIATSDLHLEHKLKLSRAEVLEEIERGVKLCRSLCESVEYSAEDATRTDLGFLKEAFACAIEAGATVLNIPDTVGYTLPSEYFRIVSEVMEVVDERPVVVSTHCHNDLGLAVANSLSAISAGARQVECCINGIGERAGNAALEEIVMALRTREDLLGCTTRIHTQEIAATSKLVSKVTGMVVQPNKPIVGRNAFAHESGIHQHGMLNDRRTYEIMQPEDVGLTESKIVLGKLSGRFALKERLTAQGYRLTPDQLSRVFERFKRLADKKKNIYDEDLAALVAEDIGDMAAYYELVSIEFRSGSDQEPWAKAALRFDDETHTAESEGNGPVHAAIEAIKQCTGRNDLVLEEYRLDALTGGSDAQGRVSLTIKNQDGLTARGHATHIDVVVASANAFVHALNHEAYQREIGRVKDPKTASGV